MQDISSRPSRPRSGAQEQQDHDFVSSGSGDREVVRPVTNGNTAGHDGNVAGTAVLGRSGVVTQRGGQAGIGIGQTGDGEGGTSRAEAAAPAKDSPVNASKAATSGLDETKIQLVNRASLHLPKLEMDNFGRASMAVNSGVNANKNDVVNVEMSVVKDGEVVEPENIVEPARATVNPEYAAAVKPCNVPAQHDVHQEDGDKMEGVVVQNGASHGVVGNPSIPAGKQAPHRIEQPASDIAAVRGRSALRRRSSTPDSPAPLPGERKSPAPARPTGSTTDDGIIRKSMWSKEEDARLLSKHSLLGGNWALIAESFPGRTKDQCRSHWDKKLNPAIKKTAWTPEEDRLLASLHTHYENRWAMISQHIPGRTNVQCRNRWFRTPENPDAPKPAATAKAAAAGEASGADAGGEAKKSTGRKRARPEEERASAEEETDSDNESEVEGPASRPWTTGSAGRRGPNPAGGGEAPGVSARPPPQKLSTMLLNRWKAQGN